MTGAIGDGSAETTYAVAKERAYGGARFLALRYLAVGLISLGGSTVLIRELGPEAWATFSVAYYLVVFFDQSFSLYLLGQLVRSPGAPSARELRAATALMHLAGAGVATALIAISGPASQWYGRSELSYSLVAVACCAFVYSLRGVSAALLERDVDYRSIAIADILDQLTFYAIAIPLIVAGHGLPGVALALAVRGVVPAVVFRWRKPTPMLGKFHRAELRRLLAFGVPSLGLVAVIGANGLVPLVVLGGENARELAYVLTAGTIVGYAITIGTVVQRVGFPSLASLQRNPESFRTGLQRLLELNDFATLSIVAPLAVSSPLWLPALFGSAWDDAGIVMAVLGAGVVIGLWSNIVTVALNALGHARRSLTLHVVMTISYLILAIPLARVSTLIGVPLAFALTRVGGAVLGVRMLRASGYPFAYVRPLSVLTMGSAAMVGVALLVASDELVAAGATGVAAMMVWLLVHRQSAGTALRLLYSGGR